MSNREIVIDLLSKLPENVSLEQIAREIELLAGTNGGPGQARRREGISSEVVRKKVDCERTEWADLSARNLARAYGNDEPEYSVADIKS